MFTKLETFYVVDMNLVAGHHVHSNSRKILLKNTLSDLRGFYFLINLTIVIIINYDKNSNLYFTLVNISRYYIYRHYI